MFSDLLNNLFNEDEQIRTSAEHLLIQFKDENPDQYVQELINIIAETQDGQNIIEPKIQQASVVFLGQIITSGCDTLNEKFNSSFFEELLTLLIPKMNSENYNLAYSSAVLFGESLSFLIRENNEAFSRLIELLNSEIEFISLGTTEIVNLNFLLVSIISFLNSNNSPDLETDQTISLFQALHQLYGSSDLTNEILQAISAMIEDITDTFNQYSQRLSSSNSAADECQPFISALFDFFSQLLEKASTSEENKVSCYNFFRLFFKYVSISFFNENISKVLELVISDISSSTDESVLISSIHFLKTTLRREYKLKNQSQIQFTPYYKSNHFDSFLMPLIRVYAMIPQNETYLDSDYAEYQTPHLSAQEMISIFVRTFPEHSSKILIPLIICLSPENCNLEESTPTSFSLFESEFELDSFIAIETSLFLLCLIIEFSTNLPSYDFIISFIGSTLSSPSVRIRCASFRALNSYLKHGLGQIQSDEIEKIEEEDEILSELNDIYTKLSSLAPEIIKHIVDDHPIISCYSMRAICKYSGFPIQYDAFSSEIILPLFLEVIENHNNYDVIGDAFKYLEKIIHNRKIEEVFTLIEPVIQLLGNSNHQENNIDYNESLRALIVVIVEQVTVAALPYYEVIYSLLIDHIEPQFLICLSTFSKIFDHDFPQNFQNTFELIFNFLSDTDQLDDDRPLQNKIVSDCCFSILIISKSDLFTENSQKTASLLLNLLSKNNSNLNLLIGISALCLYQRNEIKEFLPTFYQIISQINIIDLAENRINVESNEIDDNIDLDNIVSSYVNILMACYKIEPNDQDIINLVVNTLQSIVSIGHKVPTLLEMAFDLILFLNRPFLLEIENIASELIKVSNDFDDLKECVETLKEKIFFEEEEDDDEEES